MEISWLGKDYRPTNHRRKNWKFDTVLYKDSYFHYSLHTN